MTKVRTVVLAENMETMYQNDVAVDPGVTVVLGAHHTQDHPHQDGVNRGQFVDHFHFEIINDSLCPNLAQ